MLKILLLSMLLSAPVRVEAPTREELLADPPTLLEIHQVESALAACKRKPKATDVDLFGMLALLRLEPLIGVPGHKRGILLSAWCWEASFRSEKIRGDYREGVPTSFGPFQMQQWWLGYCGFKSVKELDNVLTAASCYWKKVLETANKSSCKDPLAWGQAMIANPRKYRGLGCKAQSHHWRQYALWDFPLRLESEHDSATSN